MDPVDISDVKARFAQLVEKVAAGEDVVVSRNGKPLVRITRVVRSKRKIRFGLLKGKVAVAADFDAPLPVGPSARFDKR